MDATANDASTTARANILPVRMRSKPTIRISSCKRQANTNVLGISPGARSLTCSVGCNSGTGHKESSRWSQGKLRSKRWNRKVPFSVSHKVQLDRETATAAPQLDVSVNPVRPPSERRLCRAGADMFEGRVLTPEFAGNNRCEKRKHSVPHPLTERP